MPFPNPLYISSTPLQWYFVDKGTAEAMAGGIVTFYEQDSQTTLKPIYQLDDSSPTGFSVLNNPIQLTAVGTFADNNGNDIIPYFYPFNLITGLPELYYVTVYNSAGVLQFTREDWPPNMAEASSIIIENEVLNFVANGQFLLHNNKPTTATIVTNESDTVSYIAPGGWTFEKESTSTSTDVVSFVRELTASSNPLVDANPRYYISIATNGTDANYSRKDLCLTFPDVNKFADNTLTFSWQGYASTGGTPTVEIILRQYFGTGSSTAPANGNIVETVIGTQIISSTNSIYNISIPFPPNTNDSVGPTIDNDYLQICLRLPNSAQTVLFTDFVLTPSVTEVTAFPQTPNDIFIEQSTIGYLPTPAYDGSDLYLPLVLTPQGTIADHSVVGQIIGKTQTTAVNNELLMNGATFVASAYSTIGIPYQRLMNYLLLNSSAISITQAGLTATLPANSVPMYGTGPNFVTLFNKAGAPTSFFVQLNTVAAGTAADVDTGWTFTATVANTTYTVSAVTVPTAGQYWTFTDGSLGLVYNVWYSIAGVGTAPIAPTGANIQVNLTGTPTIATTIAATLAAVNQYQFMILNTAGYFWRALDTTATIDLDAATRTIPGITFDTTKSTGANLASFENQAFLNHIHNIPTGDTGSGSNFNATLANSGTGATSTSPTGGDETRPVNLAINYFIKY
jgi:hypothetical protein